MKPSRIPARSLYFLLVLGALFASVKPALARGGKTIDPNYLSITDCPNEPGCPALVLLDKTELSNASARARLSRRRLVKVFTNAGAVDNADVTVIETLGIEECRNLSGRTILPDGTSVPLKQENIFVKPAYRKGRDQLRVKAAKFPGVVPGVIIEVSYDLIDPRASNYTEWVWRIQGNVPILKAHLTLRAGEVAFNWLAAGQEKSRIVHTHPYTHEDHFDAENIPSMPVEPFAPPVGELGTRVYLFTPENQVFWMGSLAARFAWTAGKFLDKGLGIPEKVKELVPNEDPAIEKVRRIYQFVQERIGTEEERLDRREKTDVKDADDVGEVLKRGFGNDFERTMLFLAMVRETGLPTGMLVMADRRNVILNTDVPDEDQFESYAAAVKVDSGWTFYDPAVKHCAFGMISWYKEGGLPNAMLITPQTEPARTVHMIRSSEQQVQEALRLKRPSVPYQIAAIPFSKAADNVLLREAVVRLSADGSAEIDVSEQAKGQVDLERRETFGDMATEDRQTVLVERLRETIPDARVISASFEGLEDFEGTPTIRYHLVMPALGVLAGNQMVLAPSLFGAPASNPFTAPSRRTQVHFQHTQKTIDRITIETPDGFAFGELPRASIVRQGPFVLVTGFENLEGKLVFSRRMEIDAVIWPLDQYPMLRTFFEASQEADRQVVVLRKETAP